MMDVQSMITQDYNNKLTIDLSVLKFNDWDNEEESDRFCEWADKIQSAANGWLRMLTSVETIAVGGVNIMGNNFSIAILTPEDCSIFDGYAIPVELRSNGKHVATFFIDWNKKMILTHVSKQIVTVNDL